MAGQFSKQKLGVCSYKSYDIETPVQFSSVSFFYFKLGTFLQVCYQVMSIKMFYATALNVTSY